MTHNEQAYVFCDHALRPPRLDHPEQVAVHPDGSAWRGGEAQVATTGGFILGVAFDRDASALYVAESFRPGVTRVAITSGGAAGSAP
jgi:gluconolactonase